jgi:very-short-patch-repair endonuclease
MNVLDLQIAAIAARQDNVFTRSDVLACGGSQKAITVRLESGRWQQLHPGVYLLGAASPTWLQLVRAGVLAAGEDAQASHRCGLVLWGADGLRAAPVEVVVPYLDGPAPKGVLVHRSRRVEPVSVVGGIPTTAIERTLLESATVTPPVVTEKAFAWAWRRGLTTPEKCDRYLEVHGGKGRRGTIRLREVVALYAGTGRPPGSDGEVVFLRCLREAGVEEPVRQHPIDLPGGDKAIADFAWPDRRKLIEFVGLEVHADSRAHAADTLREDDIKAVGWELRRFAPQTLHRQPEEIARRVLRFLLS